MTNRFLTLVVFIVIAIILAACAAPTISGREVQVEGGIYRAVNVQELSTMLEDKDFLMVNVHTPWQGDIQQTDQQLPFDQIEQSVDQLPARKDDQILLYCYSDGMAKTAAKSLIGLGYSNVWMLEGGTVAWEEAGFTLEK
ncbi:MAG: rhodanese-like domain-containing protein [Caldilineales bacterium]|nr:rhodanese-like domain-containing protein [Caldilineales bacterium]